MVNNSYYSQFGGVTCKLCGSDKTNRSTCPLQFALLGEDGGNIHKHPLSREYSVCQPCQEVYQGQCPKCGASDEGGSAAAGDDTLGDDGEPWTCPTCTFINDPSDTSCTICGQPNSGWSCPACTLHNPESTTRCVACGESNQLEPATKGKKIKGVPKKGATAGEKSTKKKSKLTPAERAALAVGMNDSKTRLRHGYHEQQRELHCAKHALNHVFQEPLVVIRMTGDQRYQKQIGPKWNIHAYCLDLATKVDDAYPMGRVVTYGISESKEAFLALSPGRQLDICDNQLHICGDEGNYQYQVLLDLLSDMGFRCNRVNYSHDTESLDWGLVSRDMEDPDFLGLVILKGRGGAHYTSVSSTVADCWVYDDDGNVMDRQLAYLDSIRKQWVCKSKDDMIQEVLMDPEVGDVEISISIFKTETSVDCRASRILAGDDARRS